MLLHSGYDFTPSNRTDITEQALRLATDHANVYLEISAMFSTEDDGVTFKYPEPGGESLLRNIKARGLLNKLMFGADANWSEGGVKRTLRLTVEAMLNLDFTEDEVCRVLGGTASEVLRSSTE